MLYDCPTPMTKSRLQWDFGTWQRDADLWIDRELSECEDLTPSYRPWKKPRSSRSETEPRRILINIAARSVTINSWAWAIYLYLYHFSSPASWGPWDFAKKMCFFAQQKKPSVRDHQTRRLLRAKANFVRLAGLEPDRVSECNLVRECQDLC